MNPYIDAFVLPIPRDRLDEYQRIANTVADIWKEYGALDYMEFVGDDLVREGTGSFRDLVTARDDDAIIFGWVSFGSRESRDRANQKVAADGRMGDLLAPLTDPSAPAFDASRMAYGGFLPLVSKPR